MNTLQKKWSVWFTLWISVSLLLGACDYIPWAAAQTEPTPLPTVTTAGGALTAEGRLAPLRWSALAFQSPGEVGEILVREGEPVAAGQVLVRLGNLELLEASLNQAQLERLTAQQALDELKRTDGLAREQSHQALVEARIALNRAQIALNDLDTDDFQQQLDDRRIAVNDAREVFEDAEEDLEQYQDLEPDNPTRENAQIAYDDARRAYDRSLYDRDTLQYQLDQAQAAVDFAQAALDQAEREYNNRFEGVDPDTLSLAEARLKAAEAQEAAAERTLQEAALAAPYGGTVVDLHDLEAGELAAAGQAVVTLADFSTWMVETRDLTELDVVDVEIGQDVEVTPDALPDLVINGTVETIDQVFGERSGDILYTVRIRLDDMDERLRWGMTVNAIFDD